MRRLIVLLEFSLGLLASHAGLAQGFDHAHGAWDALLKKYVVVLPGAHASRVRYAGFAKERVALKAYLAAVSAVTQAEFDSWSKAQRMAFLINAYNAFTVEKILTRYPDLKSIRDFGTVFGNPWKDDFFMLFGHKSTLDQIEHEMLRKPGAYDDARVHYAVNCASISCPMLREEAYTAAKLERQLDEQAARFLSDRSRNRYNPADGHLEVSKIYDWFGKDFGSLDQYFAGHAKLLTDTPEGEKRVADGKASLSFLDYDWSLNDAKP